MKQERHPKDEKTRKQRRHTTNINEGVKARKGPEKEKFEAKGIASFFPASAALLSSLLSHSSSSLLLIVCPSHTFASPLLCLSRCNLLVVALTFFAFYCIFHYQVFLCSISSKSLKGTSSFLLFQAEHTDAERKT